MKVQYVAIDLSVYPVIPKNSPLEWADKKNYLVRPWKCEQELAGFSLTDVRRSLWVKVKLWWRGHTDQTQYFYMRLPD